MSIEVEQSPGAEADTGLESLLTTNAAGDMTVELARADDPQRSWAVSMPSGERRHDCPGRSRRPHTRLEQHGSSILTIWPATIPGDA